MFVLTIYFPVVFFLCVIRADEVKETKNETEPMRPSEKEFRPSPQLETIYEHNEHPVIPAAAEAKQSTFDLREPTLQVNSRSFWPFSEPSKPLATTTTEQPWVRKVVFPQSTVETIRDTPYPFITSNTPHFGTYVPPRLPPSVSGFGDDPRGYGASKWDKEGGNRPLITHKTHYEGYGPPEQAPSSVSPLKKIIGLLAAFIPIGLLISALTPSVIQVIPMNTTQSRSRSESPKISAALDNLAKIQGEGCEERILCELLLSAGASKNAEEHIENLLQTFTEQERDAVQKAEELQKIYAAVGKQNCKSLVCRGIEEKQGRRKLKIKT